MNFNLADLSIGWVAELSTAGAYLGGFLGSGNPFWNLNLWIYSSNIKLLILATQIFSKKWKRTEKYSYKTIVNLNDSSEVE